MKKEMTAAVACGDPAGISYEIVFKTIIRLRKEKPSICFLLAGERSAAEFALKHLNLNLDMRMIKSCREVDFRNQKVNFVDLGVIKKFSLKSAGRINALLGRTGLLAVKRAYEFVRDKKADALVTAPLNKKAVCLSFKNFTGHTEFLAKLSKTGRIAMMLAGEKLKVTLVTRHVPLKKVSGLLNEKNILSSIELTDNYLRKFCRIKNPKIGLCALNPHAGEDDLFGLEEKAVIAPAAKKAVDKKIDVIGPLPADSVFEKAYRGEFEAVICLYHDQGLVPLKMVERQRAVNITLGLPFIRTSPAHGTAYDIAYQNKADSNSCYLAVKKALEMAENVR